MARGALWRLLRAALVTLCAVALPGNRDSSPRAATFTATTGGADYALGSNWDTGSVPTNQNAVLGVSGTTVSALYSGTSDISTTGILSLGSGGVGTLTMSGTATLSYNAGSSASLVGSNNGAGTLIVNSGTVTTSNDIWLATGGSTTSGTITVAGGVLNIGNRLIIADGTNAQAVVNLNSGTISNVSTVFAGGSGNSASETGTFNLNGGVLRTGFLWKFGASGTYIFNFNGGTLMGTGAQSNFLQNSGAAGSGVVYSVNTGGAKIDTTNGALTIAAPLVSGTANDGGLTKLGANTLTLSASSTYVGTTTVSAGTLTLNVGSLPFTAPNGFAGGGGITVNSGATLVLANGYNLGHSQALVINGGTVSITAGSATDGINYTKNVTFAAGGTITGNPMRLGDTVGADGGSVTVTGSVAALIQSGIALIGASGRAGTFNVGATGAAGPDLTISGVVADFSVGGLPIVKSGAGTLAFTGANTYTGSTTISAGTILANSSNALGTSARVTLNDANTGTNAAAILVSTTSSGTITLGRPITVANQGSGTPTIGSGTFATGSDQAIYSGAVTLAKDVTLLGASGGDRTQFSGGIGGTGNVTIAGAGRTMFVTTANTYAGSTTINGTSTLQLGDSSSTTTSFLPDGQPVNVGGMLSLAKGGNSETIDALLGSGTVRVLGGADTLIVGSSGGSGTFSGVLVNTASGTLAFTKSGAGTQVLTGSSSYSGATTISSGTLQLGAGGTTGALSTSSSITISSGAMLAFNRSNQITQNTDLANVISGAGGIVVLGGTASLSNANTYTGNIAVNAGALLLSNGGGSGFTVSGLGANTVGKTLTVAAGATLISTLTDSVDFSSTTVNNIAFTISGTWNNNPANTANTGFQRVDNLTLNSGVINDYGQHPTSYGAILASGTITVTGTSTYNQLGNGVGLGLGSTTINVVGGGDRLVVAGGMRNTQVSTGAPVKTGTGTLVITGASSYSGGTTISSGTIIASNGSALGSSGVTLNNASTGANNATLLISTTGANITVGNAITVANQGTGVATIGTGTFAASGNQAIYSGTVTLAKDVTLLGASGGDRTQFSGGIVGTGNVTVAGSGRVLFRSAANTYAGSTTITAGSQLQIGDGGATTTSFLPDGQPVTVSGTLNLAKGGNSETIDALLGGGMVGAFSGADTLVVGSVGGSGTFSGVMQNNGATLAFTKSGAGTQVLTGTNIYTGATTITGGTLQIGNGGTTGSIASTSAVSGSAGAALAFARSDAVTYSGTVSGAGNLVQMGSGTLTLSAANAYTGTTSLAAGVLSLGGANAIGTTGTISFNGGTLQFTVSNTTDYSGRFSTSAGQAFSIDTNGQGVTFGTALSGSGATLTKLGSGTLTLTAANTYSGNTTISAGVVRLGSGGAAGSVAGGIVNNGTLVVNRSDAYTLSNAISGTGGIVQMGSGTTTLSGVNSYSGATTITGGVLSVSAALNLGTAPDSATPGNIVIDGGSLAFSTGFTVSSNRGIAVGPASGAGSGTIDVAGGQTVNYAGVLANNDGGTGGLTKAGAGLLALSGNQAYTGATAVNAGTLQVTSGSLASTAVAVAGGATLSGAGMLNATTVGDLGILTPGVVTPGVGGIGTLTLASLTFTGSATVNVGVQSNVPSSLLLVNGDVTTTGANTVTFAFGGNLASITSGTYSLLSYTGTPLPDVSAFGYSGSTGARQSVNLVGATGAVNLVIGNAFPIWSGADGTGWSTTDNWMLNTTGSATSFLANDTVVFNDSSSQGSVTLAQNVNPTTTTFSGTTRDYVISSAGGFGITSGNLVKSGPATLTVTTSNSFSGGTTLSAGTIRVGNDAALGTGVITISGSAAGLTLSSDGGTARTLANGLHLDGDVTLGNATDNGALAVTGTVTFDGTTRVITTPSDVTLAGLVTNGGFTKAGAGVLTVTGSNDYAAGTTLSAGTLRVGDNAALGTGAVALNGGDLSSDSTSARTLTNAVTIGGDMTLGDATNTGTLTLGAGGISLGGATRRVTTESDVMFAGTVTNGGLTKAGAGTLTLAAANSYAGGTSLSAGVISLGNAGALGSGTLTVQGDATVRTALTGTFANGVVLNSSSTGTFDAQSGNATFSGAVSGSGALAKVGGGTLTLSAANSYSGGTRLSAGTLAMGNVGSLGSGRVTVAGNASILTTLTGTIANAVALDPSITGTFDAQSGAVTYSGVVGGSGALAKAGVGTVVLTATSTYAGDTSISAGTLQIGDAGVIGGGSYAGAISNSGTLSVATSANQTLSGVVSGVGSLAKSGAGTLTLSNASNSFAGGSTITAGVLAFSNGALGSSGTVSLAGGTLRWAGGNTQDISSRLAVMNSTTSTLDTNGNNVTFAGTFGGGSTGGLVKAGAGTLIVTGSATSTGLTTVSSGTVQLGNGGTTGGLAASGTITIASGATLAFNRSNTITQGTDLGNVISGSGGIVVLGGTASLSNANTYTGNVLVSAGTLLVSNGVAGGGTTSGLGANTVGKTLTVAAGATLISTINDSVSFFSTSTNNIAFTISGTWTNNPSNAFNGFQRVDTLTLNGGVINDSGQFGGFGGILAAGSVTISGTSTYNQLGNGVGLGLGTTTINVAGSGDRFVVNGGMRNTQVSTGAPTKTGNGTLLLTGTSTYSGATTITGGTFAIGAGGRIYGGGYYSTGAVTVGSGATLDLQNWAYGETTQNLGGLPALASAMVVNGGTIRISGSTATSSDRGVTVNSGGATFEAAAGADWTFSSGTTFPWSYNGNPTVTLAGGGTGRFDQVLANGSGGLVKSGTGTWTLGGVNTFSGNVSITGGTLVLGGSGQLGGGVYAGAIVNDGQFVVSTSANQTLSGVISGSGSLAKSGAGTLTLSATQSFTGVARVDAGTLAIGGKATLASASRIFVASGATLDATAAGLEVGSLQTLAGSGTIAGGFTIADGATLSPGNSPGTLAASGTTTWGGGGNYNWQIHTVAGGAGTGTGWDFLDSTGSLDVTASGTDAFNVNMWSLSGVGPDVNGVVSDFSALSGYSFLIAEFDGGITGWDPAKFSLNTSAVNGTGGFQNDIDGEGSFVLARGDTVFGGNANQIYIVYAAVPEPGTLVLVGIGLAAVGLRLPRRRQRRV